MTSAGSLAERRALRARLLMCVAPRVPADAAQRRALREAALAQWRHERAEAAAFAGQAPPSGVSEMRVGHFSVKLSGARRAGRLSPASLCPEAYALLYNAGLLYRGLS